MIDAKSLSDYAPVNPNCTIEEMTNRQELMRSIQTQVIQAQQALNRLRDELVDAEISFHEGMLDVKSQVIAQYGPDSHAVQLIGLTRKSEYRRQPQRKKKDNPSLSTAINP